jgi:hypothetical protein
MLAPVAGEGQASRTNQQSEGATAGGSNGSAPRSWAIDAHQPVAPVPVPAMTPDED